MIRISWTFNNLPPTYRAYGQNPPGVYMVSLRAARTGESLRRLVEGFNRGLQRWADAD